MSNDNLVLFGGPSTGVNHPNDVNVDDDAPNPALGVCDDDAFATAAASVTYGPVFDPTVGDGDNGSTTTTTAALDRRLCLWQQVLNTTATTTGQPPEPLHELDDMMTETQDLNLLGLAPIDVNVVATNATAAQDERPHTDDTNESATPHNNNSEENQVQFRENQLLVAPEAVPEPIPLQQTAAATTDPTPPQPFAIYPPTMLPPQQKGPMMDNNNDNNNLVVGPPTERNLVVETPTERPLFASPLKKRRHHDLIPAIIPPTEPPATTTNKPSARQQMDNAFATRQLAKEHLEQLEAQWARLESSIETARENYQRSTQEVQSMTDRLCDELLLEDTPWNAHYRLLRVFYQTMGHANVRQRRHKQQEQQHTDLTPAEMGRLTRWVGEQRRNYRQQQQQQLLLTARENGTIGSPTLLEDYQILALERLGFDWDPLRSSWQRQYQRLQNFAKTHGHTRVPYKSRRRSSKTSMEEGDDDDDRNDRSSDDEEEDQDLRILGTWVKRQRYQYKLLEEGDPSSDMTPERIKLLNDLKFEWKLRGNTWMDYYNELAAYQKKHGNTLVPCSIKQLNLWTNEQRQQYRLYQEDPALSDLTPEQAKLLKDLGLAEDLREGKWYRRYQELRTFYSCHGHCIVPTKYAYNQQLVNWCATQRRQYKFLEQGKKSQLTPDRVQLLNDIGFKWTVNAKERADAKLVEVWDEQYAECLQHHNEFGSLEGLAKDSPLHRWLCEQRQNYRQFKSGQPSPLLPDQIEQLERLGLAWGKPTYSHEESAGTMPSSSWEERYADLLMYRLNHGSFSIPETERYKALQEFVKQQRREYIKFKQGVSCLLNGDRVRKLQKVGFPWKTPDGRKSTNVQSTWEEMFGELLAFRLTHNSFDVSRERNERLYNWIQDQRHMYRRFGHQTNGVQNDGDDSMSLLRSTRIKKLEDVSFPWG